MKTLFSKTLEGKASLLSSLQIQSNNVSIFHSRLKSIDNFRSFWIGTSFLQSKSLLKIQTSFTLQSFKNSYSSFTNDSKLIGIQEEDADKFEDDWETNETLQEDVELEQELGIKQEKASYLNKYTVALVGRPNVGKSTLFNRLIEGTSRKAIVTPIPGTTRDRSYGPAKWLGKDFTLVDTGGLVGFNLDKEPLNEHIKKQTEIAMAEADCIIFVVDSIEGMTQIDRDIAKFIRANLKDKHVVVAANKADTESRKEDFVLKAFEQFGLGPAFPISSIHGEGVGDLLDKATQHIPREQKDKEEDEIFGGKTRKEKKVEQKVQIAEEKKIKKVILKNEPTSIRVAIVGQPNAGKSSLLNYILKEDRSVVSDIAGTTHDPVDSLIDWKGNPITLIDTAGITRQAKLKKGLSSLSVIWALRQIERSHVVVLLIDPIKGVNSQDVHIAAHIQQHNKSAIVAVNKWDLLFGKPNARAEYDKHVRAQLKFLNYVPIEYTSTKTGFRMEELMDSVVQVFKERSYRFKTKPLMDTVRNILVQHPPPSKDGKKLQIKFATQTRLFPPTFVFWVNDEKLVHFSYERFLENAIRARHKFVGTPIRLVFKKNEGKQKKDKVKSKFGQRRFNQMGSKSTLGMKRLSFTRSNRNQQDNKSKEPPKPVKESKGNIKDPKKIHKRINYKDVRVKK